MKKLMMVASFLVAVNTITSQTAKTSTNQPMIDTEVKDKGGKNVPSVILNKFKSEYPGEQPTWSMDDSKYRADFVDGKSMKGHSVAYDSKGNVMYREEQMAPDRYPSPVVTYYTTNYPGEKYEVWSSVDNSGKQSYYAPHNMETLWFDQSGTFRTKSKSRK